MYHPAHAELDGVCGRLDDLEFKLHLDNKLGNGKRPTMKIKVEDGCCAAKKVVDAIDHLKYATTTLSSVDLVFFGGNDRRSCISLLF